MSEIQKTISEESEHSILEENSVSEMEDNELSITLPELETEVEQEAAIQEEAEVEVEKEESSLEKPLAIKQAPILSPAIEASSSLEVEVNFLIDTQRLPLTEIRSLAEGKVISLGCAEFEASLMLQQKKIAQARLVLVEGRPSVQITKVFTGV